MNAPALLDDAQAAEHDFPSVGELVTNSHAVAPDVPVRLVADRFFSDLHLDAVAVVDNGRPAGLVTRGKFLFTVFRQFGWEIYQRKPIEVLADPSPAIVRDTARLDAVLSAALERKTGDVYDEVVVVREDGTYAGLLSVRQMIIRQTHALANIVVQKELAHERAREIEEVARIKSQFLANVTHELRSPVNAIIELAELMRISADQGYVEQVRDRLMLMMTSATSLRGVITNMLDLSKIEAGRMQVIVEPFDLVLLLREVAATAQILLGGKPVEVLISTDAPAVEIVSDPVKVRQVVLNLAGNAAKFTDAGRIVIQQTSTASAISISVSDTGIGIRPDDLSRLFVAFSQVQDAHTKRHEGSGLGLAITKELAELLGGRVVAASEFGRGSTFTVHLPKEIAP